MGTKEAPRSIKHDKSDEERILQPYTHITQIPGKNIRSKLAKAFNYWLCVPEEKMNVIEDIINMLHNASLLYDDIEDNSVLRRGIPVAHSIYGVSYTLNAALYSSFSALENVMDLNDPKAVRIYTEHMLELHRGQGMELYWRDNVVCPTEEEYCLMAIQKTSGLFEMCINLMQLFSINKNEVLQLCGILGLAFQILDDYKNLTSTVYFDNKSYCEDLTEGKFSFPLIHAIRNHQDGRKVLAILRQRSNNVEVKKNCVRLLEKCGSFEYTRKKLVELKSEAVKEIKRLGANPAMDKIIELLFGNLN